jgi:DNA invertase Pin-like site-specific DNA recombinase
METNIKQTTIEYCLYARKSTEDDERQAMSIDSQIKEMTDLAIRDNLYIKEVRTEKHSAKASGRRPVFAQLLEDIRNGVFNGILTWAPDRLSRNAGDLGMLVDLMDQEKLGQIKTFSQSFSNNPNEKFLLMILCSQAKLENDNRGINVKRGMRARCSMGWRPTAPPVGYLSQPDKSNPQLIITDPERAFVIKQMFERVGNQGQSGRTIKSWLDRIQFTTKNNKGLVLSKIYTTLKNPFYYGRFEWPVDSGIWYEGKHEPLVSKELFDKVQLQLQVPPKAWKKNIFPFKKIFICGGCSGGITAEVKLKKLKLGGYTKHIYYHCARSVDYDCDEPYITEEELIRQLIFNIDNIKFNFSGMTRKIQEDIERYHRLKSEVLNQEYLTGNLQELTHRVDNDERQEMMKNYLKHILTIGTSEERQEILAFIKTKFILQDRHITVSK